MTKTNKACLLCGGEIKGRRYCGDLRLEGSCQWKVARLRQKIMCMIERCTNPTHQSYDRYKNVQIYGGWLENRFSFVAWALNNGWGLDGKTVIDRIDNDKGYTPDNCRFVTCSESNRNRRNSVTDWEKQTRKCRKCGLEKHFFDFAVSRKEVGGIAYECNFCRKIMGQKRWENSVTKRKVKK